MPVPRLPGSNVPFHGVPAGTVVAFAAATAPKGWLACDGSAVSRTIYARLFAVLGTTYGSGDGSTTFNLPDCTGRAIFGKEASETRITTAVSGINGGTLGAAGGSEILHQHSHASGTLAGSAASDGAHSHTERFDASLDSGGSNSVITGQGSELTVTNDNSANTTSSDGAHTHTVAINSGATANAGTGTAQNMPPAIILYYIVKF